MIPRIAGVLLLAVSVGFAQPTQPATNSVLSSGATNQTGRTPLGGAMVNTQSNAVAHVFWPDTFKDWVGVLQAVAVIAASCVGFRGITAWRKEFVGRRRIELAEEVLALFYQAKDIVEFLRFPAGYEAEASGRKAQPNESPEQKRVRDDAYATRERYNQNSEVFSRIFTLRYRFMAQFGRESTAPFAELKSALDELFVALNQWVMLSEVKEGTFTNPQSQKEHRDRIEKYENTLWGMEENNPIQRRLNEMVTHIERICESRITGRVKPSA